MMKDWTADDYAAVKRAGGDFVQGLSVKGLGQLGSFGPSSPAGLSYTVSHTHEPASYVSANLILDKKPVSESQ
jgi:hypothetical protein